MERVRAVVIAGCALLASTLLSSAFADGARTVDPGCGGDAFSFAEVVEGRAAPGPLVALPDTLCAELEETRGRRSAEPLSLHLSLGAPADASGAPKRPDRDPRGADPSERWRFAR